MSVSRTKRTCRSAAYAASAASASETHVLKMDQPVLVVVDALLVVGLALRVQRVVRLVVHRHLVEAVGLAALAAREEQVGVSAAALGSVSSSAKK